MPHVSTPCASGPLAALLPAPVAAQAAPAACPALLQHSFPRLQDEKPQSLCQYAGKVLLVVNTASYCGFTPQYKGLEELYARYRDAGLVVLGFPSNDFAQEPGSNAQIADFCENTYGVKFPMFAKTGGARQRRQPAVHGARRPGPARRRSGTSTSTWSAATGRWSRSTRAAPRRTTRPWSARIEQLLAAP